MAVYSILIVAVALFVVSSILTNFNVMTLVANADAFWTFIAEDFFPPALPKLSRIPGILDSVMVTVALALSATTIAAILAFFVSLFGSEKVSPFLSSQRLSADLPHFEKYTGTCMGVLFYSHRWA